MLAKEGEEGCGLELDLEVGQCGRSGGLTGAKGGSCTGP